MNNLKDLRQQAGLTQEQLAQAAGLSKNYISQLERGTRSVDKMQYDTMQRICAALNCSIGSITSDNNNSADILFYSYWGKEIYFKTDNELSTMDPNDLYNYLLDVKKDIDGHAFRQDTLTVDLYRTKVDRSDIEGGLDNLVSYTLRIVPYVDTWDCYPPIKDVDALRQHAVKTFVSLTKQHKISDKKGLFTFKVFERYYEGYPFDYWSRG